MIRIEITTAFDQGAERDQIVSSMSAIGFAPMGSTALSTGVVSGNTGPATGDVASSTAPNKRQTAAEKKAAEKAAAEAAAAAGTGQGISSGEERADPEAEKQDAKDEAADTAKEKAADPVKLTHDDVKKMLGAHVQAYGMAASQADVKLLLNNVDKLSAIPDTQKDLAAAILSIANAIEKNPRNHDIDGDGLDADKLNSLKPIVAAAKAVK